MKMSSISSFSSLLVVISIYSSTVFNTAVAFHTTPIEVGKGSIRSSSTVSQRQLSSSTSPSTSSSSYCQTLSFVASNFVYLDVDPPANDELTTLNGIDTTECNEVYDNVTLCPGTQFTLSADFYVVDDDRNNDADSSSNDQLVTGIYNIHDVFAPYHTTSNQLLRNGYGSFIIPSTNSALFIQTYQQCDFSSNSAGDSNDDNNNTTTPTSTCQTFIGITGGVGDYACATGTIEFVGSNDNDEITYTANICNAGCFAVSNQPTPSNTNNDNDVFDHVYETNTIEWNETNPSSAKTVAPILSEWTMMIVLGTMASVAAAWY